MLNPDYRDMLSGFADAGSEDLGQVGGIPVPPCSVQSDVHDVCLAQGMIRKQLYITEAQEEALKERARSLGVSEAELVRRALDAFLAETSRRRSALDRLLEHTHDLAERHRLPSDYDFDREELHAHRESRRSHCS